MEKTVQIIKNNIGKILLLSIIIVLPVYIFQEFFLAKYMPVTASMNDKSFMWYSVVSMLLSALIMLFRIAVIKISFDELYGKSNTVSELMEFSMKAWPKSFLTTLLWGVFIVFGFMLFIIPGFIFYVLYYLSQHVIVKDEIWGKNALFISQLYAKNNVFKIILLALLTFAISFLGAFALDVLSRFLGNNWVLYSSVSVLCLMLVQIVSSFIDVYIAVFMSEINIGFDVSKLKRKKSENDE